MVSGQPRPGPQAPLFLLPSPESEEFGVQGMQGSEHRATQVPIPLCQRGAEQPWASQCLPESPFLTATVGTVTAEDLTAPSHSGLKWGGPGQPLRERAGWKRGLWLSSTGEGMVAWPLVLTRAPELGAPGWVCCGGGRGGPWPHHAEQLVLQLLVDPLQRHVVTLNPGMEAVRSLLRQA